MSQESVAAVDFPDQLDFGRVAINVDASCTCPLAFMASQPCKWSITHLSSSSFSIHPSSGTMQGEGVVAVSITFCPFRFTTERCNVQVGGADPIATVQHTANHLVCHLFHDSG